MDPKDIVERIPELRNTLIGDLFNVMSHKNFIDTAKQPLPGENIIGEMNDLEKSLLTLSTLYDQSCAQLIEDVDRPDLDPEEREEMSSYIIDCGQRSQIAISLLDESIRKNFFNSDKKDIRGWEVRSGFKVVPLRVLHTRVPKTYTGLINLKGGEA